jgi:hypothetical protein
LREAIRKNRAGVAVLLLFLALFALGIALHRDYGISWDEPHQRYTGAVTVKHLAQRFMPSLVKGEAATLPALNAYVDRDHGTAFELPAAALEAALGLKDKRDIYVFRHLLTFLMCYLGMIAVFRLAARRFSDWRLGLLAVLFLVLSPRLFAESFFNSKDAVFMAAFAIGMTTAVSFVLAPGVQTALTFALATAFAVDIRLMAVILPVVATAGLAARLLRREAAVRPALSAWLVYMAATSALTVVFWVWLWTNPVGNFLEAFSNMVNFRWQGDTLLLGQAFSGAALPWFYGPVWLAVTTPPFYLALFVLGVAAIGCRIAASGATLWKTDEDLQDLFFLGLAIAPFVTVALSHSVLYGGWRHLYFVYPAFLLVAVRGWHFAWSMGLMLLPRRTALVLCTASSIVLVAVWMIRAHPIQNVYFNVLAGVDHKSRYDLDYWGLANRQALEYILKNDPRPAIKVQAISETPLDNAFFMIPPPERERLVFVEGESRADYAIDNFYGVRALDEATVARDYELFHEQRVDQEIILSIYKAKGAR